MLEALLAFIDQVLPGRFALAGTSLGAYLARAVAARRRSRIAGLLLRVPCIFAEDCASHPAAVPGRWCGTMPSWPRSVPMTGRTWATS